MSDHWRKWKSVGIRSEEKWWRRERERERDKDNNIWRIRSYCKKQFEKIARRRRQSTLGKGIGKRSSCGDFRKILQMNM